VLPAVDKQIKTQPPIPGGFCEGVQAIHDFVNLWRVERWRPLRRRRIQKPLIVKLNEEKIVIVRVFVS
jgi:hypothetical protein